MKKEFVVNYHKKFSNTGCVYRQTVNITKKTLNKLTLKLIAEINNPKFATNYLEESCLKNSFGVVENGLVYMNLTQRRFFDTILKLNLKDRNTCFCIID